MAFSTAEKLALLNLGVPWTLVLPEELGDTGSKQHLLHLPITTLVAPPLVAVRGRKGIGVLQGPGQGGDDYPLTHEAPPEISQLLADAYLAYHDPLGQLVQPFRIRYLYGFGNLPAAVPITPAHDYDVEIVDAEGTVVFDSLLAVDFQTEFWAGRLLILAWTDDNGQMLRLVQHIAWGLNDEPRDYDVYIEPSLALLDVRVLDPQPLQLRSVRVGLTTLRPDAEGVGARLRLKNGFNTTLAAGTPDVTDGGRRTTVVTVNAVPGSGLGRFGPGCGDVEDSPLRRIGGAVADASGNLLLDTTGCYRLERPVLATLDDEAPPQVRVRAHALQLSNDCGPCCECDDFIAVWEAIRRMRDIYADLVARAQVARDLYHGNRQRYLDAQACRDADRVRLLLQPGCNRELGISAAYCNGGGDCIQNLVLHLSFEYADGTGDCPEIFAATTAPFQALVSGSTFRSGNVDARRQPGEGGNRLQSTQEFYQLGGEYPHFWAHWDAVNPAALALVTFRLQFDEPLEPGDGVQAVLDAYVLGPGDVTINEAGSPVPGYVPGSGPLTTPPAMQRVSCPVLGTSGLLGEC